MGKKVTLVTLTINRPTINMRRRTPPFTKYKYCTIFSRVFFKQRREKKRMKNKGGWGEGKKRKQRIKKRKEKKKEVTSNVSSSRDQLFACATN